ncbi:MAG: hypothetical protein HFH13_13960 [Dorea sp.]|nr:hypothetical protein [Dorea sp.]
MAADERLYIKANNKGVWTEDNYIMSLKDFMFVTENYIADYLKAILFCNCKWGTCTYDDIPQNTNTCEGIMALILAHQTENYADVIQKGIIYLTGEVKNAGLVSKSLGIETVVPTAMYLYICKKSDKKDLIKKAEKIAYELWSVKSELGWGLYVRNMFGYANVGCTYWAVMGLEQYSNISESEFQLYLSSLFKYNGTYCFGQTINDVNPQIPCLYSTAMMYIIYMHLTKEYKKIIGKRYNREKAIAYIVKHFDNPFFLVEQEGIDGVEMEGKTSVHTVNWSHLTIHYSLRAIALAIENREIDEEMIREIIVRIYAVLEKYSGRSDGRLYWSAPNMTLERGKRGKIIFPTMHVLIGISYVRDTINHLIQCLEECEIKV